MSACEEEARDLVLATIDSDELETVVVEGPEVDRRDALVCTREDIVDKTLDSNFVDYDFVH